MLFRSTRNSRLRAFLALTLFAWIAGAAWHGAMRVGLAFGNEVCTSQGAKVVPGVPAPAGHPAGRDCPLCASFGAPASVSAVVAVAAPFVPIADSLACADRSPALPASHLADLASRAPPRA